LIPVDRAQVGMVLAEPIQDRRGRLLIPAGKELTERYLGSLPMWGVTHVDVEGAEDGETEDGGGAVEPWAISLARDELEQRFLLANRSHPVMKELLDICTRRRSRSIQKGGAA